MNGTCIQYLHRHGYREYECSSAHRPNPVYSISMECGLPLTRTRSNLMRWTMATKIQGSKIHPPDMLLPRVADLTTARR